MKIAVIGDLHLGFRFDSELGQDAFINARKAMEKALSFSPDLILLMGDIFDTRVPKPEILAKAIELFGWLNSQMTHKIKLIRLIKDKKDYLIDQEINPIITIYGTHELRHTDSINPVQLLHKAGYFRLIDKESLLIERNGQIGIHGLSGVPDQFAKEIIKEWKPRPFDNMFNILLFHQTFKDIIPQADQALEYTDLPNGFSLIINGHIHWQQEDKFGKIPVLYTGSTVITQLKKNECGKSKGIYQIVADSNLQYRFIPIEQCREAFYVEVDCQGLRPSEINEKAIHEVESVLLNAKLTKPQVKIKLSGELPQGFLPTDVKINEIIKKFDQHAFIDVDKGDLSSSELTAKAQLLGMLDKQKSIEEVGMQILCEQMGITDKKKVMDLFNKLAED